MKNKTGYNLNLGQPYSPEAVEEDKRAPEEGQKFIYPPHTQAWQMLRDLTALRGAVSKWEEIAYDLERELGVRNCSLCILHYGTGQCYNCPIQLKTGLPRCAGTPYKAWVKLQVPNSENTQGYAFTDLEVAAAEQFVTWLKALKDEVEDEIRSRICTKN